MTTNRFATLLKEWEAHARTHENLVREEVALNRDDARKIDALAEVFRKPREEIVADLLQFALQEVEEGMPYVKGSRVIRVEEGFEVYEDAGRMPAYLEALRRARSTG